MADGGSSHVALKKLAERFLQTHRSKNVSFEHAFCGYYPDVLSIDKTIVVECGHTQNPAKMLDYFRQGNIAEYIQIPYPSADDVEITGYMFIAGDAFTDFITFLEDKKRDTIREIIRRRE